MSWSIKELPFPRTIELIILKVSYWVEYRRHSVHFVHFKPHSLGRCGSVETFLPEFNPDEAVCNISVCSKNSIHPVLISAIVQTREFDRVSKLWGQ